MKPSNAGTAPWLHLARACRALGRRGVGGDSMTALLECLLDATHAERAFLVRAEGRGARDRFAVDAVRCRRRDGIDRPSRSALTRALSGRRAFVCVDGEGDEPLVAAGSIRGLGIRAVLAAPLPGSGARRALLLDSRLPPPLRADSAAELLESFAALAALLVVPASRPALPDAPSDTDPAERTFGHSAIWRKLLEEVDRVAPTRLPVLIHGESGCGKEQIARRLHRRSTRREGPFVAVNCAALNESLLEAELFGVVRGAYTGAERDRPGLFRLAHGGSLLLDEVGDTPPAMQAKLLRVLQERKVRPVGGDRELPVDVRLVATTHRDLAAEAAAGAFREDLYYRLAIACVRVPPLRERRDDLPLLVTALLPGVARETGRDPVPLTRCAHRRLAQHDWPGNVRELQAVLARGLLRCDGRRLGAADLDLPPREQPGGGAITLESEMIRNALRDHGGIAAAARRIGWTRQKLYRRMGALGIPRPGRPAA